MKRSKSHSVEPSDLFMAGLAGTLLVLAVAGVTFGPAWGIVAVMWLLISDAVFVHGAR